MVNWRKVGDTFINQPQLAQLGYGTDGNSWYIKFTFDGVNWNTDYSDIFATEAAVVAALSNYVATLG